MNGFGSLTKKFSLSSLSKAFRSLTYLLPDAFWSQRSHLGSKDICIMQSQRRISVIHFSNDKVTLSGNSPTHKAFKSHQSAMTVFSRFDVSRGEHFEIAIKCFWCHSTAVRRFWGMGDDTIHALIRVIHDGQVFVEYVPYWCKVHNKSTAYDVVIPANMEIRSNAPFFISFFLLNDAHGSKDSALRALNLLEGGIVAGAGNGANQAKQIQDELVGRATQALLQHLPDDPMVTLVTPVVIERLADTITSLINTRDGPVFYSSIVVRNPLHFTYQSEKSGILHGEAMTHGARYSVQYFVKRQTQRLPILS